MKTSLFNRKTLTAVAMASVLALGAATAQAAPFGKRGMGPNLDYIFGQLSISETQGEQVIDILRDFRESKRDDMKAKREAAKESGERPSEEERTAMKEAYQAELSTQLNTVLSANQTAELMEYLEAHGPKGKGRKGRGGPMGEQPAPVTDGE